jgi:hypothetical protein
MSLFDSASLVVTPNGTKASKLYAIKPTDGSGDLVVTRATTATRVNSSGLIESVATNVPRLDYTNSTCPSILVEPQRTNLALRSQEFDNAYWVPQNVTLTANNTISPNGTLDADLVNVSATNGEHNLYNPTPIVITANVDYTFSYFVKKGTGRYACAAIYYAGATFGPYATYDLNTNTLVASGAGNGTFTSSKLETFANDWVRISVTGKGNFLTAILAVDFRNAANLVPGTAFTGTNETYSIWGAQLELGSYPTSFIPTAASIVTRNADVISKTGISSLIGQTEGTLYAEYRADNINISARIISVSNGTFANRIVLLNDGGSIRVFVANASVGQVDISFGTWIGSHKIAVAYANNDLVVFLDGVLVATDTSISVPTCSDAQLGTFEDNSNGNPLGGSIKAAALWKTRLSNTELATLTTI